MMHREPIRLPLPGEVTPEAALERLHRTPGLVLLQTAGPTPGRSLLSARPRRAVRWGPAGVEASGPWPDASAAVAWRPVEGVDDPLRLLGQLLPDDVAGRSPGEGSASGRPFRGGWIGYLGYEVADLLEVLPPAPPHDGFPTLWFGAYDWAVVWSPGVAPRLEGLPLPGAEVGELRRRMEGVREQLLAEEPGPSGAEFREAGAESAGDLRSSLGRAGYEAGVERIREYIRAGDLYQANLTHRVDAPWSRGGVELYRRLLARSPAPYAAYLDTGDGEVASISPESFLRLRGDRVTTRPIKGTAPRGASPEADRAQARALLESEKDRAENVMIVDLMRNDLSRVCRPGSVTVPHLLSLETHPSVHHLVSTVEGRLGKGKGPVDLLRATLPGGSITGAPKIRAMEILRELEPVRRGVYTGALGVLEFGGDLELSIAIRTATLSGATARYGVGGGITLASDPAAEWQESMDKAAPFVEVVGEGRDVGIEAEPAAFAGPPKSAIGVRATPEPPVRTKVTGPGSTSPPASLEGAILVLDNYDSFVHNVGRYLRELAGPAREVRIVRSDAVSVADILRSPPTHLLLSPGPCTPDEAGVSVELVQALGGRVPILGICLGHQAVARAFGAQVVRAAVPIHGRASAVHHDGEGILQGLPSPFQAGRYHSLVVAPDSLPAELEVVARDDTGTVMAIRHRRWPVWGVQFHPESILTAPGHRILAAFLKLAGGDQGVGDVPGVRAFVPERLEREAESS